ncbi:MAG: phosphoglycerate kinase, partial [archaeon]
ELIIDPLTINIVLRNKLNMDIGTKTINKYSKIINSSRTIYIKGTPGAYEINNLDIGTRYILNAITKSRAYSLAGGGHTSETILKYKKLNKFSYVSLAGGALIEYLAGKKLPGVESLKNV